MPSWPLIFDFPGGVRLNRKKKNFLEVENKRWQSRNSVYTEQILTDRHDSCVLLFFGLKSDAWPPDTLETPRRLFCTTSAPVVPAISVFYFSMTRVWHSILMARLPSALSSLSSSIAIKRKRDDIVLSPIQHFRMKTDWLYYSTLSISIIGTRWTNWEKITDATKL